MSFEIEKKYLITQIPSDLEKYRKEKILQGYILVSEEGVLRVRKKGNKYIQTIKGTGDYARKEIEIELNKEQFEILWPLTKNQNLTKYRYYIDFNQYVIELDLYTGNLEGLVTAEVEFSSEEEGHQFTPPAWFGQDITYDRRYKNYYLAKRGMPA